MPEPVSGPLGLLAKTAVYPPCIGLNTVKAAVRMVVFPCGLMAMQPSKTVFTGYSNGGGSVGEGEGAIDSDAEAVWLAETLADGLPTAIGREAAGD